MDVRSALARMTRAAVHLADQTPAVAHVDRDRRPDGWSARPVGVWMTLEHHGLVTGLGADRQPQMQAQEGAGVGSGVAGNNVLRGLRAADLGVALVAEPVQGPG